MPPDATTRDFQETVAARGRNSQPERHVTSLPETLEWLPVRHGTELPPLTRPPRPRDPVTPPPPPPSYLHTLLALPPCWRLRPEPGAASVPLHLLPSRPLSPKLFSQLVPLRPFAVSSSVAAQGSPLSCNLCSAL